MATDFNRPQRQSLIGILVMFAYSLQAFLKALWPILLLCFLKYRDTEIVYLLLVLFLFLGAVGLFSYLKYLNFTFYIDRDSQEFVITEGIVNKSRTTIQLQKIQQVNINQSFIQKFVGVFQLVVDTAGTSNKEVDIKAISYELAIELKARLLEIAKIKSVEIADGSLEVPFIKISFWSLLKIGITSNYVKSFLILLAFFLSLFEQINQLTGRDVLEEQQIRDYFANGKVLISLVVLFVVFFLIVIVFNIVKSVITYFDFRVSRENQSLLLHYGLFNTKSSIIKPEKVQIVSISQNLFQKKMDVLQLRIRQASGGKEQEEKQDVQIPGCNTLEKDGLLQLLFGSIPEQGVALKPNFRKFGFAVFLTIFCPLLLFFALRDLAVQYWFAIDFFVILYVIFVGIIQVRAFKNYRLSVYDKFIVMQSGAWDITNKIISVNKIQAITTSQLFWHKKVDIGSVILHTAAGNISFQMGNFTSIKNYVNLWLYEIETTDSDWM